MTIKTETIHAGEHLLSEGNGNISRESIVIASGKQKDELDIDTGN